ncbi:TonB-dependent receptor [Microbulbifer sp. VAAF005]|uniref:TonB-dependent receptor domain-containing protein n=1 Tax=Microbulbifer sp. VAAF005 TaxID=3034230 RepID=UPI0024AD46F5|nr:TonB-dependent receptor [Microbulbifer sp. VAAF005]WHI48351.1 TonB-dependent receptor [Microbulbifer sp. VAAF005]
MAFLKRSKLSSFFRQNLVSSCSLLVMAPLVVAAAEENTESSALEEVAVVGSQIKGADVEGTLPVSVIGEEDIALMGAASGDELLRSIPQMGQVGFNESVTTGVNAARGDVNSINLRSIGTGNTLVLLNGRRMVLHPGTQTENYIPVVTVNSNTLPVNGLERVEVLRDGAAALYGADAVAGVVNYVMKKDYDGAMLNMRYGASVGTELDEFTVNGANGFEFNDGATKLNLTGTYYSKNGFYASERDYSANSDLRGFFTGDSLFEGDTSLDNRSSIHGWGAFDFDDLGLLHVRPTDLVQDDGSSVGESDCSYSLSDSDICLDDGSGDRALRGNRNSVRMLSPDSERINLFSFLTHELENGSEFYTELGYYRAEVDRVREAAGLLSNSRFEVPADYYWNPFGPVYFDDGTLNPNRIVPAGDENVPDEGLGFTLTTFTPYDVGLRKINVVDTSYRFVSGLRGNWGDWDWDTGLVYSEAETIDSTDNRVSHSLFQQSLMLDTEDAYNLFSGLDVDDPTSLTDPTPNSEAVLDTFRINVKRQSQTSLALADFKVSNANLFSLQAGDVGLAAGIEWREESFDENRDDRSDGTIQFTDEVTGELVNVSDIMGSSASPDADGSRRVMSLYAEMLVPLLRDLPLVDSLDMQLALRHENFSDVGSVTKPKLALSWYVNDWFQIRGAYSEGFRAPNLMQLHQGAISVVNTRTDPVTGESVGLEEQRLGNADLQPEENWSHTYGFVLTPFDGFTFTADYWDIRQEGVVGILGASNGLALDAVLREQGSYNPNVIRAETTDGSVGEPILFLDEYLNLDPREISGMDFSAMYSFDTDIGNFDLKWNGAYLIKFDQDPSEEMQILIDAGEVATNAGSLIGEDGRPRWRSTLSMNWRQDQWGAGVFAQYTSAVTDTSTLADSDTAAPDTALPVDSYTTVNANVDYRFVGGMRDGLRIRLGMNNIFDEEPDIADEQMGYFGSLYSNRGRYVYLDVAKNF